MTVTTTVDYAGVIADTAFAQFVYRFTGVCICACVYIYIHTQPGSHPRHIKDCYSDLIFLLLR